MTAFLLTLIGAALAVGLELLEAMAIVLAVGSTRRPRDAVIGAAGAVALLAVAIVVVGPLVLARLPLEPLQVVIGTALLLFGLEWLRKGVLRLAGARAPSSSLQEYLDEREAMEALPPPEPGKPDWPARIVAGKGVLLEGLEVVLIVAALGAGPEGLAPAIAGAAVAVVFVIGLGFVLHRPLARLPESHLKYAVGVVLSSFGVFFLGEGLGVEWPGGDAALLYLAVAFVAASQAQIARRRGAPSRRCRPDEGAAQARARRDVGAAARRVRDARARAGARCRGGRHAVLAPCRAGSCCSAASWLALAVSLAPAWRRR